MVTDAPTIARTRRRDKENSPMSTATQEQAKQSFALDTAHSNVEFIVRHLMISKVRGRFSAFTGTIEVPVGADLPSSIDVEIDVDSVDTREPQRDGHLKSPDFFDVATYPKIAFRSKEITGTGDSFKVRGDLTIHGTTREVLLDATFEGRGNDPWGNERVAYEARTTINRKDFGMTFNMALETGGVMVGDEVRIELNVEAVARK
jgi:polyisoprenoid-binding protein YceI